ncbi:RNA 2',3'-cyclic phosphodiesterase [Shimazuella sp. AN120528]|uniref:RNA 2',3'-cyclic phosphodiesterase n=1 Tax=Shimazuella soli TaxID=1892854 RepID=UPI001F0F0FF3|nr:RNA 2',3'-cyclic phosphodiesterase [Shimazuella soli]MCH5584619.1 RNA 2',3'-cyclic phosphodiesterase [Shimazuella soli]
MNKIQERRTFVALPLPTSFREQLGEWIKETQKELPFRKWIHPQDIHITLHFLGSTSQEQLEETIQALRRVCQQQVPFELSIDGLGTFGKSDQPRIFWAGVRGQLDELRQLQKKVTTALTPIGFPPESRPYNPHITLARKYTSSDFDRSQLASLHIGNFKWVVDRAVLYETILGQGPMYHEIGTFSFVD